MAASNGIGTSRVDEVLEIVGLTEVAKRRSGGFSLGMGQRLGIASALLGDPEVIMLDEPVNGLDPEGIVWIRHLLQDLAKEGRTVFVSSHLMSEMALMAEHFVIIGRGELIEDITAEDLRAKAVGDRTSVRADRLDDLVGLMRRDGVEIVSGERETVSVSGLDATEIGSIARDNGIALASLIPEQRSLEDVFMELTHDSVEYHGGRSKVAA
jgi:ABC-2 type transport system ATP-binding protein